MTTAKKKLVEHTLAQSLNQSVEAAVVTYCGTLNGTKGKEIYKLAMQTVERQVIESVLGCCDNHRTKAAEILGISRPSLQRKMSKYKLLGQRERSKSSAVKK